MMQDIKIYIGKYQEKILAVSPKKDLVVSYLNFIRRLSRDQIELIENQVDENLYRELFQREILEELKRPFILPRRDCECILRDIQRWESRRENLLRDLEELKEILAIEGYYNKKYDISSAQRVIEESCKKRKFNKGIERGIIKNHPLLSMSIDEYLKFIQMDIEEQSLKREYRYRLMS